MATDGSRLHARYSVGDDGSKTFEGWHDTMLNEPCEFERSIDGSERCLPGLKRGTIYFKTSMCSGSELYVPDPGCDLPLKYVKVEKTEACGITQIWEILDQTVPNSAPGWQENPGGFCIQASGPPPNSVPYFNAVQLTPSQFVGRTIEVSP